MITPLTVVFNILAKDLQNIGALLLFRMWEREIDKDACTKGDQGRIMYVWIRYETSLG